MSASNKLLIGTIITAIAGIVVALIGLHAARIQAGSTDTGDAGSTQPEFSAAIAGTWVGRIEQNDGKGWPVKLSLTEDSPHGTVSYSKPGCSGNLTLDIIDNDGTMHVSERIVTEDPMGEGCTDRGTIILTPRSDGLLDFDYVPIGDNYTATAVLTKSDS